MTYEHGCPVGTDRKYGDRTNDGKHRFTRTFTGTEVNSDDVGKFVLVTDTCKLCGCDQNFKSYIGIFSQGASR